MSPDHVKWHVTYAHKNTVRTLVELAASLPDHDTARCQIVTAWLLGMWQMAGGAISPSTPSFLLIGAKNEEADPVWSAFGRVFGQWLKLSGSSGSTPPCESATDLARCRGNLKQLMARGNGPQRFDVWGGMPGGESATDQQWKSLMAKLFPGRMLSRYHGAWDAEFGLVTAQDNHISLLVRDVGNRDEFLKDLRAASSKLTDPTGYSERMRSERKSLSIIGSLQSEHWTCTVVEGLWITSVPTLHLPYIAPPEFTFPDPELIRALARHFPAHIRFKSPHFHEDPLKIPMPVFAGTYEALILRMAAEFPIGARLALQLLLRELQVLITRLCGWIRPPDKHTAEGETLLALTASDLYQLSLRGIAYGVAAHGFLGLGPGTSDDRAMVVGILQYLRGRETTTKRDVQRKFQTLNADHRDLLLDRLVSSGLIHVSGKEVAAVPFADFLLDVPRRHDFPELCLASPAHLPARSSEPDRNAAPKTGGG